MRAEALASPQTACGWPTTAGRADAAEQNAEAVTASPLLSHEKGERTEDHNKFDGLKTFSRKSQYVMV